MTEKKQNKSSRKAFIRQFQKQQVQPVKLEQQEEKISDSTSEQSDNSPVEGHSQEMPPPVKGARLRIIYRVFSALVTAAAIIVLTINFAFPIMRVYGTSMSGSLADGDIVIAQKTTELAQGDICVFYFGGRMHCKRVIGLAGDVIEIDEEGTVTINGTELVESYLKNKSLGQCDIEFPYTVPNGTYFVLGDNRRNSIDSRSKVVGNVTEEQMVGRLIFCIYPFLNFGRIE